MLCSIYIYIYIYIYTYIYIYIYIYLFAGRSDEVKLHSEQRVESRDSLEQQVDPVLGDHFEQLAVIVHHHHATALPASP